MSAVAVLGLGRMGAAIAGRLLGAGHEVVVWNRTPGRAEELAAQGAAVAETPAEAAAKADVVITMLADPAAVEAVVGGAASALRPGACLVEMSTIGPEAVRGLRAWLPDGVGLVDAPVMGSVPRVVAGEVTVLAGGDVERAEPVLATLGRIVRCGDLGSGAALKLVLMSAMISGVALVSEALALADALDVPQQQALAQLAAGPLGGVVARARATGSDFPVALAAKDLGLALGAADLPLVGAARDTLRRLAESGAADEDLSYLVTQRIGA